MDIKLKRLVLDNFKGIRHLELGLSFKTTEIHGDNATGKTSIVDAFCWLLFGKDSTGKADFQIKTLVDGEEQHKLQHSVEAVISFNGEDITLKRIYAENWVNQRGSRVADLKGHETSFLIDGVPCQLKEWNAWMAERFNAKQLQLVTSITSFNSLPWQDRRLVLLDVCGEISDADIIASNPELKPLSGLKRSVDDEIKVQKNRKKEVNDEIKGIPERIDSLQKSINEYMPYKKDELAKQAAELKARIDEAKATDGTSELIKQKAALSAESDELIYQYERVCNSVKQKAVEGYDNARSSLDGVISDRDAQMSKRNSLIQSVTIKEQQIAELRVDFDRIKAPVTIETECPTCGQTLPEDKINATKARVLEEQNSKLAANMEKGKALKAEIAEMKDTLLHLNRLLESIDAAVAKKESAVAEAKAACDNVALPPKPARLAEIDVEISALKQTIDDAKPADTTEMESALDGTQKMIANAEHRDKVQLQIAALNNREKELTKEYEECERIIYLIEQFTITKVGLLEQLINNKFKMARFKLFKEQINGGIAETCITLYDGVPYGYGLNRGAEINVGLDIVNTLSEHYGLKAPVFVDNAESVTRLVDIDAQLIKLVVDANAKTLEVA